MPVQRHYGGHDLVVSVFSNILSRWHCWIEALLGGIPLIVATEEKADSRGRGGAGPGSCHTNTLATNTRLVAIAEKKKQEQTTQIANSAQTEYCSTFLCVLVTGVTSQVFSII